MKLTMTQRGRGTTAALADTVQPEACAWHAGRDGQIAVALPGNAGHSYTLHFTPDELRAFILRAEDFALRSQLIGLQVDGAHGAQDDPGPVLSGIFSDPRAPDPTPQLTADNRSDMWAAALDLFRRHGEAWPAGASLANYGFTQPQIELYGSEAIAAARRVWEREGSPNWNREAAQ